MTCNQNTEFSSPRQTADAIRHAWHAAIVAAYAASPVERVVDIAARYGTVPGHVSNLARAAWKRGELDRLRGKGFKTEPPPVPSENGGDPTCSPLPEVLSKGGSASD